MSTQTTQAAPKEKMNVMGAIVDRTNSRWGKFKPYIVIAPPFLAIFNILTFTVFPMEGTKKAVVCLLCYIGVGMAYTVVQVAVNGLVNRLSRNSQIKMDIISMSQVGSALIQTALGASVMPVILHFSSNHDVADAHGYFMAAIFSPWQRSRCSGSARGNAKRSGMTPLLPPSQKHRRKRRNRLLNP